ncbi:MAG: Rne/Rng family ribonuclease [Christensenellales bacterium]|nr:Rne/Rng family ribonuclease [Christensenellales bacterium]
MSLKFLMEKMAGQSRLAVLEDNRLSELYYDRPDCEQLTGNIYLGRVQNILPGMNAAFVDIGLEKNAFLYAGDVPSNVRGEPEFSDEIKNISIQHLLRPGQELLVQVIKEPGGSKGCRVSSYVSLPGRMCVLLPTVKYTGVSRKITDECERDRLYSIACRLSGDRGMIVRTAAEGVDEEALQSDFHSVLQLWTEIERSAGIASAPSLVYSDSCLALKLVRDMLDHRADSVQIDDAELYEKVRRYAGLLAPELSDHITFYQGKMPLFDLYRIDRELEKAMSRRVWLKSGGYLVIDENEALTVFDVNTGKFTGDKRLDDTIYRMNCEAADEIARLIRLRDLGGIIIIDYIDMASKSQQEALVEKMRQLMSVDRNRTNVVGFSELGLMELTRKKQRRPLSKQLMHDCSVCGGQGFVPSNETTAWKVIREIWTMQRSTGVQKLLAEVSRPVFDRLCVMQSPDGMTVYICVNNELKFGEYRFSPADIRALPKDAKRLKERSK